MRLLERVDSASTSTHLVARLPSGPVSRLMPLTGIRCDCVVITPLSPPRLWCYYLRTPSFFKWDSWWWRDDWKQQEYKYSQWRGDKVPRAPNHGSVDWLQSRESGWVEHRFVCFERFSFIVGSSPFVIFSDGVSLIR